MNINIKLGCDGVTWEAVSEILKTVGMTYYDPDIHRRAFEASHTSVFIYNNEKLIGFGRAISDGICQAAVYDCAIIPLFQGMGWGTKLVETILSQIPDCNAILYASPGKEGFYQKQGFRKMKTGMANFKNSASVKKRGFTE